jgi:GNAT superfamily N-acetyltransferase
MSGLNKSMRELFGGKRSTAADYVWQPRQFGPKFEWITPVHFRVISGPLTGEEFEFATELAVTTANGYLYFYGQCIGQVFIERTPPGKGIILWEMAVKPEFRRKGLAAVMTRCIFRELLKQQATAFFKIRMVRLLKPGDKDVEMQNVGMGVIANRLGFVPELDIDRILRPSNITGIEVLPAKGDLPPGFKIVVKTFPLVLIAFVLDPDSKMPVDSYPTYIELSKDERVIHDWVRRGLIVISNGDYVLRDTGIARLVDSIADNDAEGREFRAKISGA